jgi:WbqC-like protein family
MIAAVMQPTYLPWMGYFDLVDQADVFVLLDTVAFSRQSWQQRNRILVDGAAQWLTVPVRHAMGAPIREIAIDTTRPWRRKHWGSLEQAYRRAPFWAEERTHLEPVYEREWALLAELDVSLIRMLATRLGTDTELVLASSLAPTSGAREEALVDLCRQVGATTYLSPAGAAAYLDSDAPFAAHGIELRFHDYEHPAYPQGSDAFVSHLSVVDLLANVGPGALETIRSGRRP